jgi:hypothetical protein
MNKVIHGALFLLPHTPAWHGAKAHFVIPYTSFVISEDVGHFILYHMVTGNLNSHATRLLVRP